MRELKFRAWDKSENNYVITPGDLGIDLEGNLLGWLADKGDYILEQFTGLRDKNGVEIYEGDIVQWKSKLIGRKGKNDVGFVGWDETHLIYLTLDRNSFTGFYGNSSPMTVIGNIHQNPDLLSHA